MKRNQQTEELINRLDSTKVQCRQCKKWVNVNSKKTYAVSTINEKNIKQLHYYICDECYGN